MYRSLHQPNKELPLKLATAVVMNVCFFLGCGMSTFTEIHLLPAGYQGDVFIIPGVTTGAPARREGQTRAFFIPADGILVTQDHPNSEWHRSQFYYVLPSGERQRLEYEPSSIQDTPRNRGDKRPVVWFERSGSIAGVDLPCSVSFIEYYVGSRAHLLARRPYEDELRFRVFIKNDHVCP